MPLLLTLLLLSTSTFVAWRYSKTSTDPDWAMFNLAAFTGSLYGRDFVDCKPPGIHLWYYALARVVGTNENRVKFLHHFLLGAVGVLVYLLTGSFWNGLAFTVLINAAWLFAFHGNVSQHPAAFLALAILIDNPIFSVALLWLAVFFNIKIAPSAAVMVVIYGWWTGAIVIGMATLLVYLLFRKKEWMDWVIFASWIVPRRMSKNRKIYSQYPWAPWYTTNGLVYLLPWIMAAVWMNADWKFWAPALVYGLVIGLGNVIRPNHLLPLVAWVALAGIHPWWVLALVVVDFIGSGLYFGGIWQRHYLYLDERNREAEAVGNWLRDKVGKLWVNDWHTGVYIYARKPVEYGMTEQLELVDAIDRRENMQRRFKEDPPEWVVDGKNFIKFNGAGYKKTLMVKNGSMTVWRKKNGY